jgi:site-specific DNA-methyltransferase (adenine-specific)
LRLGATTGAGLGYGSTATTQTVTAGYDTGGEANASRFFPCFPADPAVFRYVAKPSSAEKEEGVGVEAVVASVGNMEAAGRDPTNPRNYNADSKRRRVEAGLPPTEPRGNNHPTVKSIALMRWLIDLVTQRDDLVIDPFGGSGTTGCAALASGRRVILIERDPRYAEIARQRCAHWGAEWDAPARASKRKAPRVADAGPQGDLFAARTEPAK